MFKLLGKMTGNNWSLDDILKYFTTRDAYLCKGTTREYTTFQEI